MTSAPPGVAAPPSSRRRGAILARLLGGLFTAMAAFQLADVGSFVGVLGTFQLGGSGASSTFHHVIGGAADQAVAFQCPAAPAPSVSASTAS